MYQSLPEGLSRKGKVLLPRSKVVVKCNVQPDILCGGSGSRLWRVSWTEKPKQLVPLLNDKSLLD